MNILNVMLASLSEQVEQLKGLEVLAWLHQAVYSCTVAVVGAR